jgi:2-deoxy-D-gluconate 3-dehydrogenase
MRAPAGLSPFRLDGQVAFVTGATGGLGAAIVVALAHAGADVAVADLPNQRAAADLIVAEVIALGRRAIAVPIDVTLIATIEDAVATAEERLGPLGVAVANAGINIRKPGLDLTETEWDSVLDINLKGVFFTCQAVGRRMVPRGHGAIVALASQHGVVATPRSPAYSAAKAGVVNLVRSLAVDWAPRGVRVNAVGPTFIETGLTREYLGDPAVRADIVGRIPLGRLGTPDEVAHAVVYLASPAASLVTGSCLMADGGWTAI